MATRPPWVLVTACIDAHGGQSKANAALADLLIERGHAVHLVAHDVDPKYLKNASVQVHRTSRVANVDFFGVLALRRTGRKVARRVTAQTPTARVLVNGGCCSWHDINWVHYVHSAWQPSRREMPLLARVKDAITSATFRRQEIDSIGRSRLVVANSDLTRRHVIDHVGIDPAIVHTVYCGVDPEWQPAEAHERQAARAWLGIPAERRLAVFVGGFGYDERKGFDTLWRAWQKLARQPKWDVDLVAAGNGRSLPHWQRAVREAGMDQRVKLIGFTDRVYDLLAAADLLISPVRYEPLGLNIQEAICRGVPALVTRQAGAAEHYPTDLDAMIMPDPENDLDLADRLRRWRDEADSWPNRFEPVRASLRSHSWQAMATRIVSLAEQQANPPATTAPAAGHRETGKTLER